MNKMNKVRNRFFFCILNFEWSSFQYLPFTKLHHQVYNNCIDFMDTNHTVCKQLSLNIINSDKLHGSIYKMNFDFKGMYV